MNKKRFNVILVLQNYNQDGFQIKSSLYLLGGTWMKNTNASWLFSLLGKINAGMLPLCNGRNT